jgi:hypothetical protein
MIVPDIVRRRAESIGATAWLEGLPAVVAELEEAWGMAVGRTLSGGSEALVALADVAGPGGAVEPAVLKVLIPAADGIPTHEATALALAAGEGCPGCCATTPGTAPSSSNGWAGRSPSSGSPASAATRSSAGWRRGCGGRRRAPGCRRGRRRAGGSPG